MARSSERTQQKSVRATPAGTRLSRGPKAIYCKGFGQQGVTLQHLGCISSVQCKVLQPLFFCHHLSCFLKPRLQIYGKRVSFGAHGGALCRYSRKVLLALVSTTTDTALFLHVQDSNTSLLDFCKPGCPLGAPLAANPSKPHFLHFLPGFQCSSAT